MKAYCLHRFWGTSIQVLILAVTMTTAATLMSPNGLQVQAAPPSVAHETIQNAISTHDGAQTTQHNAHDANQTQQHQNLSGQGTAHDSAQASQHNALSQKIDDLSAGGDHSGLPPAWDKTLPANDPGGACPSNSSRFTCVMGGAAVRDNETGLVWEKSLTTPTQDWFLAKFQCSSLTTGGRKGWRLPSVHELASLADPSVAAPGPTLPPGHPFLNVQTLGSYWSASTVADSPINAWTVDFFRGDVRTTNKPVTRFVWCVRGGMNADQY